MKNTKLVPELRFPEFTGELKQETAGHYFSNRSKKGKDGLPVLSVVQSSPRIVKRDSLDRDFDNAAKSSSNKQVYPGDLAYNTMRMWQGAVAIADIRGMLSAAYTVLQPKNETNAEYFNYLFRTNPSLYKLWAYSYGLTSDRLRLYYKDFAMIPFRVPSPTEQQKIAAFLSLIDRRLTAARRRVVLLDEWKRGVMEKLFSASDKIESKLEFSILVKKEKKKFNPVTSNYTLPCIELEHIEKESGRILGTISSEGLSSMKGYFTSGQVLLSKMRPKLKKYAKPDFDGICSSELWVLQGKIITNDYLFFLVQTQRFQRVAQVSSGSKMPRSSWDLVSSSVFPLQTPDEQIRIANILTTIDTRLTAARRELAGWNEWKQGLLQKMLA